MCSTCDSRFFWLHFTHTQQENEEAITSFITCMMKKPAAMKILKKPAAMKILKKPSVCRDAARKRAMRKAKLAVKNQKANQNARARARMAARSNKPYKPRDPKLQAIAMEAFRATEVAQAASEKADKAHAAAEETQARSVVFEAATASGIGKAMEVAEQAHQEGREASNTVRIVNERRPPQV